MRMRIFEGLGDVSQDERGKRGGRSGRALHRFVQDPPRQVRLSWAIHLSSTSTPFRSAKRLRGVQCSGLQSAN